MQRSELRLSSLVSRMHTLTDQNWNRNTLNNKPYYFSDNSTEMLLRWSSVTQISRVEMSSQLQGHLLTTTAMPIILSLNKLQMGEFLKKTPSAVVIKGKVSFSNQKHFVPIIDSFRSRGCWTAQSHPFAHNKLWQACGRPHLASRPPFNDSLGPSRTCWCGN